MREPIRTSLLAAGLALVAASGHADELHVFPDGDDAHDGSLEAPLRTISAAAARARPGDVVTVHEGVYREHVDPPRGGTSEEARIVYRAASGARVVIKGSEIVRGWEKVEHDTWKVSVPDTFFGDFHPYRERISGDWFDPRGRLHHPGAVYLDQHWLTEAVSLEEVLAPVTDTPRWISDADGGGGGNLLNVASLRFEPGVGDPIGVERRSEESGPRPAPCSEGGECLGWIEDGHWVRFDDLDFGPSPERVIVRAASATAGGRIEVRLDAPDGTLLGQVEVPNTDGWQSWRDFPVEISGASGPHSLCLVFRAARPLPSVPGATTIWAQFPGRDPNATDVEINVRRAVFYPTRPGVDYLTVRGFTMMHAATPWAPPTAEQVGLIGTHWSRGWIIEENEILYSACTGITLGKYGDEWDNRSQSADAYNRTIQRALENGWHGDTIGHHVVRDNLIAHCEQAGIVGSLGAVFSAIEGNHIHDIHVRRLFSGAEMAGIKLHASIDVEIRGNWIHHTGRGIWLDWMAQGTRVTGNVLHDNGPQEDLFVEVNHGPFLVDHNVFLSPRFLANWSEGGAYAHNLIAGSVALRPVLGRETPYHPAHSTAVAGIRPTEGGDDRFFNNVFVGGADLSVYDEAARPSAMEGNVFWGGARPSRHEVDPVVDSNFDPELRALAHGTGFRLRLTLPAPTPSSRDQVTTARLGRAVVPDLPFVQRDGTPYRLDRDFFGRPRVERDFAAGPFAEASEGPQTLDLIVE